MPAVYLFPALQWFDNSGNPLNAGKIFTYAAGTTTPLGTYTDSTGGTLAANPVVLDSAGRAQIWLTAAAYKFVLQTSAGATLQTIDGINVSVPASGPFASVTTTGDVTMQQSTAATALANQSGNTLKIQARYWTGAADATDTWNLQDVIGTGANPTSTLSLTHSGTAGAAALSIPGTTSLTTTTTKTLNNIRFADQFASISAAIADLPASGGTVFIPAGTYTDNIVITVSNIRIMGAGRGVTIIKPAITTSPVLTVDATNVANIDGFEIEDLSILPVTATACDAGIQIKGKTVSNQINDHHVYRRIDIGNNTVNSTGTNNFRHGIEIIGRTIWSSFDHVASYGSRGDGLNITLTGGIVGPVNATYFTNCEFNNNYGYGVRLNTGGAVSLAQGISFINCNIEYNAQNTALSPASGMLLNGTSMIDIRNAYFEGNCPSSADVNSAHIRLTGTFNQTVNIHGGVFNVAAGAPKYGIFNDTTQTSGTYDGMFFAGSYTKAIHIATSHMLSNIVIGSSIAGATFDIVLDANNNSHVTTLSPLSLPFWVINSAAIPVAGTMFDLSTTGSTQPMSFIAVTGGPKTLNLITGGIVGQILVVKSFSGAITLTHNSGGAGSMIFNDSTTRVLQTNDYVLFFNNGTNWEEIALGSALLNKANTWSQNQSFTGLIAKYNNISTVSNGIPAEYATVDLTGQVAPITATTLYTPTATGMFRILAYLKITTTGTSPVLGPVTITYTDGTDSVAQSVVMDQQLQTGATSNTGNNGNTTTSVLTGSLVIYAKTGVAIQYAVALTGTVGTGAYEVHLKCEAL